MCVCMFMHVYEYVYLSMCMGVYVSGCVYTCARISGYVLLRDCVYLIIYNQINTAIHLMN